MQERLLRPCEVAQLLGIATRTLWRWRSEGRLPEPIKVNRKVVRWRASEIAACIDRLKDGAA